ncbi:hypothetical protein BN59_02861 [Legionella massiliensis]|uniref:Leucine Rich repeats (2 copies) n=1 Tax=Legionella massiliensis TaxID=1034943 RepID=A0A078L076_9GAMM|nr:hypothetical protein [Legionella massiliensis]CDZ78551.1 hypothetical protein BN59_02861 [Legionella massiliensis]CEE14289.1 hypothetical protein BN1094_02861 [Legionella massiliensis]
MHHTLYLITCDKEELDQDFATIPTGTTSLTLSADTLGNLSVTGFAQALRAIPASVNAIDLSANNLDELSTTDLALVLAAIPATVTSINLRNNNLFINKSFEQRDNLLRALAPHEQHGRLSLAKNGESSIGRALAPLIELSRQNGGVLIDVVNHILRQLSPNPPLLSNKQVSEFRFFSKEQAKANEVEKSKANLVVVR